MLLFFNHCNYCDLSLTDLSSNGRTKAWSSFTHYLCKPHLALVNDNEAFGTFFPYRCTYRIQFHLKNALHQSTVKAITNTQLLWHHFITGDTLKCNARAILNILKVKIGLQQQRLRNPQWLPRITQYIPKPLSWHSRLEGLAAVHPVSHDSLSHPHHVELSSSS